MFAMSAYFTFFHSPLPLVVAFIVLETKRIRIDHVLPKVINMFDSYKCLMIIGLKQRNRIGKRCHISQIQLMSEMTALVSVGSNYTTAHVLLPKIRVQWSGTSALWSSLCTKKSESSDNWWRPNSLFIICIWREWCHWHAWSTKNCD